MNSVQQLTVEGMAICEAGILLCARLADWSWMSEWIDCWMNWREQARCVEWKPGRFGGEEV